MSMETYAEVPEYKNDQVASNSDWPEPQSDAPAAQAATTPDEVINRELSAIIPVIASVMMQRISASSCVFYVYNEDETRTVAVFRYGDAHLIFPAITGSDVTPPRDIPAEAEILERRASIRRSCAADFERWPMIHSELRSLTDDYADMVVPLCWRENVYGAVYLWRYGDPGPFSDDEVNTAESLANVAAMAVEFARHYSVERARRLQVNALLDVAFLSVSHLTVEQVMPAVTKVMRSASEADVCNLYVLDESGDNVVDSYTSGLNARERWAFDQSHRYAVSTVPCEVRAREMLAPVVVRDLEHELVADSELVVYAREVEISEILVVPIVYQQAMIGVIYLWYRDGSRQFDADVISTLQGLANQAGGVISQASLYDASQRHIAETEALRRIGETVLHSGSLEFTFDEIAGVLKQMIPFAFAFVGTIDETDDAIVVERIWGKFPDGMLHYRIPLSSSLTGEAVRTGQLLNLRDAFADSRQHKYARETLPISSALISPLVTENGTIGVIYLAREREDTEAFTSRQERLMGLLCQQAAVAIERTRAREALALHAQRQTLLAKVTNQLIAAPDPVDVLQEIAEAVCGVLAEGVAIGLSTWEHGKLSWQGAAHVQPRFDAYFRDVLADGGVLVVPDRFEQMLAAEVPSLSILKDGNHVDGRELDPTAARVLQHVDARQMLTVPMKQRGRAPGILVLLSSSQSHPFDSDLQATAQVVANRIGDALERRQMADNREALLRVSETINTHADFDHLLQMFVTELHQIVPYDQMYLGEVNQETGRTQTLTYLNPHRVHLDLIEQASNIGVAAEVVSTRKAVLDNHAHLRESSTYGTSNELEFYAQHGESIMVAPLIAENQVIGVLFVGRIGANRFTESEFETFLLFTGLTASAVHRTELLQNNQLMYRASVEVLAAVVDAKDPTTHAHSRNVAYYARVLAEEFGLSASEIERIELAGLLHDIGKLGIPDHVLSKPGPLTASERTLINTHPERGASILNRHPALLNLIPLVRHHHERIDGQGYPDRMQGDAIPLGACIVGIADAFDTMTSKRTYHRKKTVDEALDELLRNADTQFHAGLVETFVAAIRENPELVLEQRS